MEEVWYMEWYYIFLMIIIVCVIGFHIYRCGYQDGKDSNTMKYDEDG